MIDHRDQYQSENIEGKKDYWNTIIQSVEVEVEVEVEVAAEFISMSPESELAVVSAGSDVATGSGELTLFD